MSKSELKRLCTQDPIRLAEQLEAAKQRELELLAVIEKQRNALKTCVVKQSHGTVEMLFDLPLVIDARSSSTDDSIIEPSQALREHEAKMLEEAAEMFEDGGYFYTTEEEGYKKFDLVYAKALRRMAEERRKK